MLCTVIQVATLSHRMIHTKYIWALSTISLNTESTFCHLWMRSACKVARSRISSGSRSLKQNSLWFPVPDLAPYYIHFNFSQLGRCRLDRGLALIPSWFSPAMILPLIPLIKQEPCGWSDGRFRHVKYVFPQFDWQHIKWVAREKKQETDNYEMTFHQAGLWAYSG